MFYLNLLQSVIYFHYISHIVCCLTYFLTPWSRALLGRLTSSQLFKKFPAFYGTQKFITTFTSACHLSLS